MCSFFGLACGSCLFLEDLNGKGLFNSRPTSSDLRTASIKAEGKPYFQMKEELYVLC